MKRTTKRYVVTTSALNCYAFRCLTEGGDISQYANNRLLLWMHLRATGNSKDQILPLGNGVDLRFEGDQLTCYLEFDESDPFAMQIYNKYENGTLNMLSLGAKPIEISDDEALKLPGQTGPTVTKWLLVEISCVDIGGNPDAYGCQLYDADDNKIEMASLTPEGMVKLFNPLQPINNENKDNMKLIQLTGAAFNQVLLSLKMDDAATEADVAKKVADLVQLSADQGTQIIQLTAAKTEAEGKLTASTNDLNAVKVELADLKKTNGDAEVIKLLDDNKDKYVAAQRPHFLQLAQKDFAGTKALLESMPKAQTIAETVGGNKGKGTDYAKLSYDEMDRKGLLIKCKADNPEVFKEKFAERFGKEYTGTI